MRTRSGDRVGPDNQANAAMTSEDDNDERAIDERTAQYPEVVGKTSQGRVVHPDIARRALLSSPPWPAYSDLCFLCAMQ